MTLTESKHPTTEDMKAINKIAPSLKAEQVEVFSAKFISDKPTANGRVWSVAWQTEAVNKNLFFGKPVSIDHSGSQQEVIGRIFSAKQEGNAVTGKFYVPKTETETITNIKNGLFRSVSINATGSQEKDGETTKILPSSDMDFFELSFVGVPGCRDECSIQEGKEADSLLEQFGQEQLKELQGEFLRYVGWTLGENIQVEKWKEVASKLDPFLLRETVRDLKDGYQNKQKTEKIEDCTDCSEKESVAQSEIERILSVKGL